MQLIIELPGIKAVSRNETTGHFINYQRQLIKAEQWMKAYGKRHEYHFEKQVDVLIEAFYDCRGRNKIADTPNIDDKIFTDTLNRWKTMKVVGKLMRVERSPWFIEDDNPTYLRDVLNDQ